MVDTRTYAPYHQHFLIARLDLDVDGAEHNTVHMVETWPAGYTEADPYGLGLQQRSVPLTTEHEGRQDYCWETQRAWKVVNAGHAQPRRRRPSPTSSSPAPRSRTCCPDDSPVLRDAERAAPHALGHPVRPRRALAVRRVPEPVARRDEGLPTWTAADRPIEDADVVLWYVFGIHHITRMEDWPIMPVDTVSFWLKPFGFFDRNPALDVRRPSHCALTVGQVRADIRLLSVA